MHKIASSFLVILMLVSHSVMGQLEFKSLHYREQLFNPISSFKDTITNHSSILPRIEIKENFKPLPCFKSNSTFLNAFSLTPLINLVGGIELNSSSDSRFIYDAGIGATVNFNTKKIFFIGNFLPYFTQSAYVRDSVQDYRTIDLGASRSISNQAYHQHEWIIGYRPNQIFTFMLGNGRNFFGEGYRSLILSDNAGSTPFFKIETNLKSIKYVNLFEAWKDNTMDPRNKSLDRRKFVAMHYISWNITREFNISIFESVVWQDDDTLINRGFDPNYLNPIVFYRPVEYNNGSADNVLLGANMSFKFNKFHSFYSQILLDDFLLAEIRARSQWWANKYAFQIGYKSRKFIGVEDLYFQGEFNLVRPFTYSHKEAVQSYGHLNTPVTHPIGANLFEVLGILAYKKGPNQFTAKITYSSFGVDSSTVSYGQDIFKPYGLRAGEYDQFIMQGSKKNVLNTTLIYEKALLPQSSIYLNATYNWRMELNAIGFTNQHYFTIGIRSRIWNQYSDY